MNSDESHTRQPPEHRQENHSSFDLEYFERNRYFQGKLLTAMDMLVEQQYHADRLSTITKLVNGTGIIRGLSITECIEEEDGRLRVTIEPGVAIDSNGRPVVVRTETTEILPPVDTDEVYIYIKYAEETKDPVPVPGAEPMGPEEMEPGRVVELFELVGRETSPKRHKTVDVAEILDIQHIGNDVDEIADEVAEAYHETCRQTVTDDGEPAVFLGSFQKTPQGRWKAGEATLQRPFVYDNEMLFQLLISHITNTDSPHNGAFGGATEYVENELGQVQEIADRLQQLQTAIEQLDDELTADIEQTHTEIEQLNQEIDEDLEQLNEEVDEEFRQLHDDLAQHREYVAHKSLKTTSRFFELVAQTYEDRGTVSRIALQISNTTKEAIINDVYTDQNRYVAFVGQLLPQAEALAEEISEITTRESYEQYARALNELTMTLEDEQQGLEVAMALDRLAESAEMLEQRYDVIPTE